MTVTYGHIPSALFVRLRLDRQGRCLRRWRRRMGKSPRIVTATQAAAAVLLHRDIKVRFLVLPYTNGSISPLKLCSEATEILRTQVHNMLTDFDIYWSSVKESPEFQQQCLLELQRLAPPPDASSDDLVMFVLRSRPPDALPAVCFYSPTIVGQHSRSADVESLRVVVKTPRWVHTVLTAQMAEYFRPMTTTAIGYIVGDAVPALAPEVLGCALALWQEASTYDVYAEFPDAVSAAQSLI